MTAVQDRLTTIGLAIQTAQASPAASATYRIGINSGTVVKMDLSEDELPTTWASRLSQGFDRSNVVPGSAFETMALPKFVGLLLRDLPAQDYLGFPSIVPLVILYTYCPDTYAAGYVGSGVD